MPVLEDILNISRASLPDYLLIFLRMSGLMLITPVFGRRNVPAPMKAGLALLLTLLVAPLYQPQQAASDQPAISWVVACLKEFAVGLILGYFSLLFFSIGMIAGQVIDIELGLGIGSIFDPQMSTQSSISGMLLNLGMLLYFLISNGHLRLIRILEASLRHAPVGQVKLLPDLAVLTAGQFSLFFGLAVSLMLPLIGSALMTEGVMGILMRAMPQLNAYMVGIPLKVLVGLMILLLMQPMYATFCGQVFDRLYDASEQAVLLLGGHP